MQISRTLKKAAKILALALLASACSGESARAQHRPPGEEPSQPPISTPEAHAADIAVFRSQFLARDKSYSSDARALAEARLAVLERDRATVSEAYFELEIARIAALADNGHTGVGPGPLAQHFNRVDIRLSPFGADYYVMRARAENGDLLGARLVGVDDKSIAEIRAVSRTLSGGNIGHRDRNAGLFIESPEQMQALGLISDATAATYHFETPEGRELDRRMVGQAPSPTRYRGTSARWLYPGARPGDPSGWIALTPRAPLPFSLNETNIVFRVHAAPELDAIVLEMRANVDADRPIAAFIAEAEAALRAQHPRNVIVDMRMNTGGNLQATRDFMRELPSLVRGRVFVLTSPWTFSAGITSTAYLKQAAPERVTIVGEMVGDRMMFFAEGDGVTLANSHLGIGFATERHDYQNGCRGFTDCHAPVVRNPIALPSLAPDIAAPWTMQAYLAGHDPAMDAVAAALAH